MSAERGWIADPPPPPPRDYIPGEEFKWRLMMNGGQFDRFSDVSRSKPSQRTAAAPASTEHDGSVGGQ